MRVKKNIILAILIFSLMFLIIACIKPQEGYTLDQAKQKVIDEVITGEAYLNVIMFGTTSVFGKDTTISELFRDTGDEIKLDEEAYIFWVDFHPGAMYVHHSVMVTVNKSDGILKKYDWNFWPIINGVSYWKDPDQYWDETQWRYSFFVTPVKPINLTSISDHEKNTKNFDSGLVPNDGEAAIVVRGDNHDDFQADEDHMNDFYNNQDISVTSVGPTDGATGVINAINTLKASPTVNDISIFVTGHGGKTSSGEPYIVVGATRLTAGQLATAMTPPPTKTFKVIINGCNSGGFIPYLEDLSNVVCIHTAAASGGYSYFDWDPRTGGDLQADPNASDTGSEWVSGFYEDLESITTNEASMVEITEEASQNEVPVISIVYKYAKDSARAKDAAAINGLSDPQNRSAGE